MKLLRKFYKILTNNDEFLHGLETVEKNVAKLLSILMIIVIFVCIFQLGYFLIDDLFTLRTSDPSIFGRKIFQTFGLFLNILIALELLENITAYLKNNILLIELVLVTSLIAIGRKIILLDLDKIDGQQMIGLAIAIFSLSISYFIIRKMNVK